MKCESTTAAEINAQPLQHPPVGGSPLEEVNSMEGEPPGALLNKACGRCKRVTRGWETL